MFKKLLVVEKRGLSSISKALSNPMREVSPLDFFKLTAFPFFSWGIPAQFYSALLLWGARGSAVG
jgi:hypothetical protein